MVLDVNHTIPTIPTSQSSDEESDYDVISVGTSEGGSYEKALALQEENPQPSFGNIAVQNSSDVHFGNKTYYQGPVTIKQILYTNPNGEQSQGDTPCIKDSEGTVNKGYASDSGGDLVIPNGTNKVQHEKQIEIDKKRFPLGSRKKFILISILISAVLVSFVVLTSILVVNHFARKANIDINDDEKIKIVPRSEWIAQPPKEPLTPLHTPVPLVIILQTTTTNCSIKAKCIFQTRWLQMNHIEVKNYIDIAYNFLIGGDGSAYEGRGWHKEGVHSVGHSSRSIGVALIGTYTTYGPSKKEISATQRLIRKGIRLGVIAQDYKLMGHNDLLGPSGKGLLESLKSWPNWGGTID